MESDCEKWRKKYQHCMKHGYAAKKYHERMDNLDQTQKTCGFTVWTWK
jgi:hypothetical protein